MICNKSHKQRVIALGAINGIVFGASVETVFRLLNFYESYVDKNYIAHIHIPLPYGYPLYNWWFLTLLSFVCATVATFAVHLCFAKYIKSSIWFWQLVSVVTVLVCGVYSILSISYQVYLIFDTAELDSVLRAIIGDFSALLLVLPIIATFNLLFALVLKWRKLNLL